MFGKKLFIEKIDIEENARLTKEHKIISLPTLIIADRKLSVNIQEEDIIDAVLFAYVSSIKL
jgi:hypothetical protein